MSSLDDSSAGAPHGAGQPRSGAAQLAQMANDIGHFFRAQSDREDAIAGIANHIASFWTRRMREKITASMQRGEAVLDELPREALRRLAALPGGKPKSRPDGDAL
jgi:formate dehydrogenase subunit delta